MRVSVRVRLGRNPSSFRPTKSSTEDDEEEEEEEEEENRALMAVTSALFMATLLPPTSMYVDTCAQGRKEDACNQTSLYECKQDIKILYAP